jgi:hypothetical protein
MVDVTLFLRHAVNTSCRLVARIPAGNSLRNRVTSTMPAQADPGKLQLAIDTELLPVRRKRLAQSRTQPRPHAANITAQP